MLSCRLGPRDMKQQRIIHFSGRVQGVGFRYTACRAAGGYEVTGFVKNLPDGSVQCVVEGSSAEIEAFLQELTSQMGSYIRKTTQQTAPASDKYHNFGVEY